MIAEQAGGPTEQYHGFFGQVERGWDGMVSVAAGAIMLFGLFLPWLGLLVVVGAVGYGIVRLVSSRRG